MTKRHIILLMILFSFSCEKWNLEREDFIGVTTGEVILTDIKSASIESEIMGIKNDVVIQHGHVWSSSTTEPTLSFNDGIVKEGGKDTNGTFTSIVSKLDVQTSYNIRAFAQTEESISYGAIQTFTTGNFTVSTGEIEYFSEREAIANGSFCCLDFGITVDQHGFCWSSSNTVPTIETDDYVNLGVPDQNGSFDGVLKELEDQRLYYYRSYLVTNFGSEVIYGEVKTWESNLENIWTSKEAFPLDYVFSAPSFSYAGYGYVFANNRLWKYNPITDGWSEGPLKNGPSLFTSVCFVIDDHAYFMIGTDNPDVNGNRCWRYDLINESWEDLNAFPGIARINAVGFSTANGKGYAGIGLSIPSDINNQDFWAYNPVSDSWIEVENYPGVSFGYNMVSFVINGKGYVGGGGGGGLENFYSYDYQSDEWTLKSTLPGGETFGATSFSINDLGYIGTGETDGAVLSKSFWAYNLDSDSWNRIANFEGTSRVGAFSFSIEDKGYVGGGLGIELQPDLWEYKSKQD